MDKTYLKLQDKTIMEFNVSKGYYNIKEPELLPFPLRNRIENCNAGCEASTDNNFLFMSFLSNRTLNINRENAKDILNSLQISQKNDFTTTLKIIILCKGLSVSDDYWITNDEKERWKDVNVRDNSLHETIAAVALFGKSLTITGKIRTPELTGQGAYAKAWKRENGELFLYKASTKGELESEKEVAASQFLDCTNVPHVEYTFCQVDDKRTSRCKSISNNDFSIVDAEDYISWCNVNEKNFMHQMSETDKNLFYQTVVVDYLISNRDRHGGNWGYYMNNHTGEIIGIHPLFDHNNAFSEKLERDENGGECLLINGKTQKEAALYAIKRCDFRITKPVPKEIFITEEDYKSCMERCCELGLYKKQEPNFFQKLKLKQFHEYVPVEIKSNNSNEYYQSIQNIFQNQIQKHASPQKTEMTEIHRAGNRIPITKEDLLRTIRGSQREDIEKSPEL